MSYTRQVGAQPAQQGRVNPAAFGQEARAGAEAAGQAAEMFGTLARNIQQAQQVTALTNAQTMWTTRLADLRAEVEKEPDPTRIQGLWAAGTARLAGEIGGGIEDKDVRRRFQGLASRQVAGDHLEILRLTARRTGEAGQAALDQQLSTMAQQAAANPGRRQLFDAQAEGAIAGAVVGNIIRADQAEKVRERYFGRLDTAEVLGLIQRNPVQASIALTDPARFQGLDPVQRARLSAQAGTAVNTRVTAGAAAEARNDRARVRASDEAAKAADDAYRAGDWNKYNSQLEIVRQNGSPGTYRELRDRLTIGSQGNAPTEIARQRELVEGRFADRANPLTRPELETMRAEGRVGSEVFQASLQRLHVFEGENARRAIDFASDNLGAPAGSVPHALQSEVQRAATQQLSSIRAALTERMIADPSINPMTFVQEQLKVMRPAVDQLQRNQAEAGLNNLQPELRSPDGLRRMEEAFAEYQAAVANRGWFAPHPVAPTFAGPNGSRTAVTSDRLTQARRLQERLGLMAPKQ